MEPPEHVILEVSAADGGNAAAFKGKLLRSFPGAYADYPVALALPPGNYRLTSLHNDQSGKTFHFTFNVPVGVEANSPGYLGRAVVAGGANSDVPGLRVEDQYDEDILLFKTAILELKSVDIRKAPLAKFHFAESGALERSTPRSEIVVAPIVAESQTDLPPQLKRAFGRFLRLKMPRAFAVGNGGDVFGAHSGRGAVESALKACNKQSRKKDCRIFAVDETIMSPVR